MTIDIKNEGKAYDVAVSGRIDTSTADQFLEEVSPLLDAKGADITIDCSELTYTSSKGLRVFLMLQKSVMATGGSLLLKGMLPAVKEVFDITGFSSIIKIQ